VRGMEVYTCTQAMQQLAELLERAEAEGGRPD
jgi:hypothetical protein